MTSPRSQPSHSAKLRAMFRVWLMASLFACGGKAKPPTDDHAVQPPTSGADAGTSAEDEGSASDGSEAGALPDAQPAAAEPVKVAPTKREPGVYPLFVVHPLDESPH